MRLAAYRPYQAFKFTVYALLATNVVLFFLRESAAIGFRFGAGLGPGELIEGFAATIDTAAWLLLLLMFELETWTLDDRHLTVRVSVALRGLRGASYVVIVYAFYGYLTRLQFFLGATPVMGASDLCALADGSWAFALGPDNYAALTGSNCAGFPSDSGLMQLRDVSTVVDTAGLAAIVRLAVVDLVNSGVWLLVVGLLELDVRLPAKSRVRDAALGLSTAAKAVLYAVLFLAAVYWGVSGEFVDFWDAFLWLVAFFFIEMNVFQWHREALDVAPTAA